MQLIILLASLTAALGLSLGLAAVTLRCLLTLTPRVTRSSILEGDR